MLCFCFKNLELLDRQTTQFDFPLSTLFVIFTSCGLKLWVKFLHPKKYIVPGLFSSFYRFSFWLCVFHVLHYQFFMVTFPKLLVIWLIAEFFLIFLFFLVLLFELLVFLDFLLVLLFRLPFLFLIFLYLIEQCNPVFY